MTCAVPSILDFHPQQAVIPTGERITIAVGIVTVIPRKKHYPPVLAAPPNRNRW